MWGQVAKRTNCFHLTPLATTVFCIYEIFFLFHLKWDHTVFVFLWLMSVGLMPSRSIHIITNSKIFFLFYGSIIYSTYTYTTSLGLVVLVVKNLPSNAGDIRDMGLNPGWGRSPGGGHGNPLQDSCLENLMDSGAWLAVLHRVTQSRTWLRWLSTYYMFIIHLSIDTWVASTSYLL